MHAPVERYDVVHFAALFIAMVENFPTLADRDFCLNLRDRLYGLRLTDEVSIGKYLKLWDGKNRVERQNAAVD